MVHVLSTAFSFFWIGPNFAWIQLSTGHATCAEKSRWRNVKMHCAAETPVTQSTVSKHRRDIIRYTLHTVFQVKPANQLSPWFSIHPYPQHLRRKSQNSSYRCGTSGCIPPTYINHHHNGFLSSFFTGQMSFLLNSFNCPLSNSFNALKTHIYGIYAMHI